MTDEFKSWFQENHALGMFLIGQAVALATATVGFLLYVAKMETRVEVLETRGAAFTIEQVDRIASRLTTVEQRMNDQSSRMDRVVNRLLNPQYKLQGEEFKPVELHPTEPP